MGSDQTLKTITQTSTGKYSEKGSKFIAYAYPLSTVEEVKPVIEQLRKENPGAVHVCFAHHIGYEQPSIRANDDGEPSNSAGTPILNQIESNELRNTLIAVVRYYGGTKLGVPGLINAYKTAAAEAIENNKIITLRLKSIYSIKTDYERLGDVLRLIDQHQLHVVDRDYRDSAVLKVALNANQIDIVKQNAERLRINEPEFIENQLI